jgi:hypothetical protein
MKAFAVVFDAFVPASQASLLPLSFSEYHFMTSVDMKKNLSFFCDCGLFKVNQDFSFSFPDFSFSNLGFKPEIHFIF